MSRKTRPSVSNSSEFTDIERIQADQRACEDILAVVKEVGELGSITSKATQKPVSQACPNRIKLSVVLKMTVWIPGNSLRSEI
jgi:hypothetical protein